MSRSLTSVTILPEKSEATNSHLIKMSRRLYHYLQMENHRELQIMVGTKTIRANIQVIDSLPRELHVPEEVFTYFCLPVRKVNLQAKYSSESNTLKLGPVIGVLTDFSPKDGEEPNFRSIHKFCEDLHEVVSENGGFLYVFSFKHFLQHGYYFENGSWIGTSPPAPDVIYNRIHSRKLENKQEFVEFRMFLEQLAIPIFNDRFLSKWEVYDQLKNEHHLSSYIPETALLSRDTLHSFLQTYETIFIKPIHGSQGKNIIKLEKIAEDQFTLQTSGQSQADALQALAAHEIYQEIKLLLQNRICIVQEGISFIDYQSSAMDLRVLVHRNYEKKWEITSIVARIGAEQEFVSNVARGGHTIKPVTALRSKMSPKTALQTLKLIKELSLETAEKVSALSAGITGELGIDVGVDEKGKPWLIEVNSKPSKVFEDDSGKIRPSAKAIIRFCTSLAFETLNEEEV